MCAWSRIWKNENELTGVSKQGSAMQQRLDCNCHGMYIGTHAGAGQHSSEVAISKTAHTQEEFFC